MYTHYDCHSDVCDRVARETIFVSRWFAAKCRKLFFALLLANHKRVVRKIRQWYIVLYELFSCYSPFLAR